VNGKATFESGLSYFFLILPSFSLRLKKHDVQITGWIFPIIFGAININVTASTPTSKRPLEGTFARFHHPEQLLKSTSRRFVDAKAQNSSCPEQLVPGQHDVPNQIFLLFKDQRSANSVQRLFSSLSQVIPISACLYKPKDQGR